VNVDRFGMVVVDGIRYKPSDAPRHKAVLEPLAGGGPVDSGEVTLAEDAPEVVAVPKPKRTKKATEEG
jgi:hypothetical protein